MKRSTVQHYFFLCLTYCTLPIPPEPPRSQFAGWEAAAKDPVGFFTGLIKANSYVPGLNNVSTCRLADSITPNSVR